MKLIKSFILLGCLISAVACSNDDDALPPASVQEEKQIQFHMGFAGEEDPLTKTRLDAIRGYNTTWASNDIIGVYITEAGKDLKPSGNYADNVKLSYKNSQWIPDRIVLYPKDKSKKLNFYAYYPYDPDMNNPLAYTFNVLTDQTSLNIFGASDFLWAKMENIAESNNPVGLLFYHAFGIVQVEIGYVRDIIFMNLHTVLYNVNKQCQLNLLTQQINTNSDNTGNINMLLSSRNAQIDSLTYLASLPPQTTDIRFGWIYEGANYTSNTFSSETVTSGKMIRFKISM